MRKTLTIQSFFRSMSRPSRRGDLSLWDRQSISVAGILNVLAGVWLINSAFTFGAAGRSFVLANGVIGLAIAIMAWVRAAGAYQRIGLSLANAAGGLFIFLSPWILKFSANQKADWNNWIVGVFIVLVGLWSATSSLHKAKV